MRYADIARMADAPTYRQMDHWTTTGLLKAENGSNPGIGRQREWSGTEIRRACWIKALSDAGVRLDVIRRLLDTPTDHRGASYRIELGHGTGVWLEIE